MRNEFNKIGDCMEAIAEAYEKWFSHGKDSDEGYEDCVILREIMKKKWGFVVTPTKAFREKRRVLKDDQREECQDDQREEYQNYQR